MSTLFKKVLAFCLSFEGDLSNHPADRGGLTWRGIARNAHPDWEGWRYIDRGQVPPDALVEKLYYERFWKPLRCDELPPAIALLLFDTAVGTGIAPAVRLLQRSLGVRVDGIVGEQTLSAAKSANLYVVCEIFTMYRLNYYRLIVHRDASQEVFILGWMRRAVAAWGVALGLIDKKQTLYAKLGFDDVRTS